MADDNGHDTSEALVNEVPTEGEFAGRLYIQTIIFKTPGGFKFAGGLELRVPTLGGIPITQGVANKNSATEKQFTLVPEDRTPIAGASNADYFPLYVEGDLKRDGGDSSDEGGVGGNQEPWHWASTVGNGDTRATLFINVSGDETDDLVLAVPATEDPRPFAEVTVVLHGEVNESNPVTRTVTLEIESDHDGLALEDEEFEVTVGTPTTVKLYSTRPSSAWDNDKINLKIAGAVMDSEDLTALEPAAMVVRGQDTNGTIKDGEHRFAYPEGETSAALCTVLMKATLSPDPNNDQLAAVEKMYGEQFVWSIDGITGLAANRITPNKKKNDDQAYGISQGAIGPRFRLTAMPETNDGFGKFDLNLEVFSTPSATAPFFVRPDENSTDPKPELYFGRLNRKNPGGSTANWHYYWSKEGKGAGDAVCQFSRDEEHADYAKFWGGGAHFGKFEANEGNNGTIYIGNKAASADPKKWPGAKEVYAFPQGQNPPNDWIQFTIDAKHAPDFVNLTYAHEATHRVLQKDVPQLQLPDDDGDGVPNAWEDAVPGMQFEEPAVIVNGVVTDPKDTDSFGGHFTVSAASGAKRDEEFYCVLGGALSELGDVTGNPLTGAYHGVIPDESKIEHDWSVDSENWKDSGN